MAMTTMRTTLLAATLTAASAFAQAQPAKGEAITSAQVEALLTAKGFTKVHDVKFKDGLWKAEAKSGDGKGVDLRIDPVSGRIYGDQRTARLGETDVRAALTANGYSKIHDLKFEDGLWRAKAEQASGQDVVLRVDPNDGLVVSAQND